jgi:hypothetical protein
VFLEYLYAESASNTSSIWEQHVALALSAPETNDSRNTETSYEYEPVLKNVVKSKYNE